MSSQTKSRRLELKLEGKFFKKSAREFWSSLSSEQQEELRTQYLNAIDRPEFWSEFTNEDAEDRWRDSVAYRAHQANLDRQTGIFQYRGETRKWVYVAILVIVLWAFVSLLALLGFEGSSGNGLCPPMYCFE